jgi:hypothetical protein
MLPWEALAIMNPDLVHLFKPVDFFQIPGSLRRKGRLRREELEVRMLYGNMRHGFQDTLVGAESHHD